VSGGRLKIGANLVLALSLLLASVLLAPAQDLPTVRMENGASQLIVHGEPFLVLGLDASDLDVSSVGSFTKSSSGRIRSK
jgi:hypothetical protein